MNAKKRDWRLFQDRGIAFPVSRLIPLPTGLISYVRELGVQDIVRGTEFDPRETETLLRYGAETDWTKTPGFLWYDYETDRFSAMLRHPGGNEDGKAYPIRIVLPESCRSPWPILEVADYNPRGKRFVLECFHPPKVASDAVPIFLRKVVGRSRPYRPYTGVSPSLRLLMKGDPSLMKTRMSPLRCHWLR